MICRAGASERLPRFLAAALAVLLSWGVLTLWVRQRWALSVLQAGVFLLGVVWAAGWSLGRTRLRGSFLFLPLAGAVFWGLAQLALGRTVYRFDTWDSVLFWTSALLLAFLAAQAFADGVLRERFLRFSLWFGLAVSVLATLQYFTSRGKIYWLFPSGYGDAMGPFVYRNNYAAFIELLLPLAVLEAVRSRRNALRYGAVAGVMYASVVACGSRAGFALATAVILAVLLLATWRGMASARGAGAALVKVAALASVFVLVVGWRGLAGRFEQSDPFVHRREMLRSSLAMARERPWTGFGLGTFEEAYPAYALFDIGLVVNHAHNDWAEWLAEGGVPFLAMTVSIAGWAMVPAIRSVWGVGLVAVFLHALVDYPMQRLGLAAWVFALLGVLAAEAGPRSRRRPIP